MKILLTNDDGYLSAGIRKLKEKLETSHEIYLCAPLRQMSASGHSITLFRPIETLVEDSRTVAVDGTPADCVKIALIHFFKDVQFDIIISGINHGANMGDDIFYSGTVAGAREGALNQHFSMAVSLNSGNWDGTPDEEFEIPAKSIKKIIDGLNEEILKQEIVLNLNFPFKTQPKGVKLTHLGKRRYHDFVTVSEIDRKTFVTLDGEPPTFISQEGSDMNCVEHGYLSITPLANEILDKTKWNIFSSLENIDFS